MKRVYNTNKSLWLTAKEFRNAAITRSIFFLSFNFLFLISSAQLKFVVEDFEGLSDGTSDLKANGLFTFGAAKIEVETKAHESKGTYAGQRLMKLTTGTKPDFGGWGKGVGLNIELDVQSDFLNFYALAPAGATEIKVEIQEDDNSDNIYKKENDDSWVCKQKVDGKENWQLVSIPLSKFRDDNIPGDGTFNVGYKSGKIFTIILSFPKEYFTAKTTWLIDFICFSKGKLPTGETLFGPPPVSKEDHCSLGAWSGEGNTANFSDIALICEKNFGAECSKKLGVVHFFQSFSVNGGNSRHDPSVERINKVITDGYVPMITLENHFVNAGSNVVQPNLYSIVEGHFDSFFGYWASQIKQVKGTVMLRMLHEFNGDWYPWCTVNNNKDPLLVGKAYRYIINIFRENKVTNVKFVWCPNSMSVPQESWNYIMDAYPGNDYVDYVGLDIYNGAGNNGKGQSVWRSFRKEGMENYFVLTQKCPDKPLLICETASRERGGGEPGQSKAEWIEQMSEALQSDMSKVRLLAWFNEKETFKLNSSEAARKAFLEHVMKNDFFVNGKKQLETILAGKRN
jgi:hypothetical protein